MIRFASMTMIEGGLGRAYSASLAWAIRQEDMGKVAINRKFPSA